ncbi:hypothetical protein ACFYUK_47630 [Nonomuraea wenchangensis]
MTDLGAWERLIALVPPPPDPKFSLDGWDELFDELGTFAAWPEPGGFLPWGASIDGEWLGWLTEGESDR